MYYHAVIEFGSEKQNVYSRNYMNKEHLVDKVLKPYINGHMLPINKTKKVINLKNAYSITVYKTEYKLKDNEKTQIQQMKDVEFEKFNCTEEFINEFQSELESPAKSDLQRKFSDIKNQVFVIMKFGDKKLDSAYEGVIDPVIREFQLEPIRVDKVQDSGKISDQIIDLISTSKYVLADLSGERPNTYYEAGYAHALGKETILTIKKDENIHFDLSGHRFIQWETEAELRKLLRERLNSLINSHN